MRDYGGSGSPLVLLHGAGGNLTSWDIAGPLLSANHRVVAFDLRGHGASGDGPWSWTAAVEDLAAVVGAPGLERPAVVGHSLGGGLAARWALEHPDCPAAVSLDGHRSPGHQLGRLRRASCRPHRRAAAEPRGAPERPVRRAGRSDGGADDRRAGRACSTPSARPPFSTGRIRTDGSQAYVGACNAAATTPTFARGPDVTRALRADVQADSLPLFAGIRTPFLLVVATRSLQEVTPDLEPLMVAFRAGLRRDLAALVAARPDIAVREFDASHAVLFERPHEVADLVTAFLADAASR